MDTLIGAISSRRVPSKVRHPIVGRVAIAMAAVVTVGTWTDERIEDQVVHMGVSSGAIRH
tara:strand:- start:169 stop:348 length:180 start_codon:yes stop_codon:yes gene_type:complete